MNIGIYTIKNKVNGKVYVGQSISLRKRKHDHFRALRTNTHYNTHLQSSWNKYGEDNFTFEVVESYSELTKQELTIRELFYIDKFNSAKNGYNKNEPNETNTAFQVSKETRKKIQDAQEKRTIYVWNKSDNSFVGEFVSISDAADKLGIKKKAVHDSVAPNSKTRRRSVGGYLFTFTEEPPRENFKTGPKPMSVLVDGIEYENYKEAALSLGIKEQALRDRLKTRKPYIPIEKRFKWSIYKEDIEIPLLIKKDAINHIPQATKLGIKKFIGGRYPSYYGWQIRKIENSGEFDDGVSA